MEASPKPRACEVCGEELFGNARQRYCSTRCRVAAHRQRSRTPRLRLVDVQPLADAKLDEDEDERLQAAPQGDHRRGQDGLACRPVALGEAVAVEVRSAMSDEMKRILAGFDRRDEPDKAGELSDEEAIAALDAKSSDPEAVDLWRTLDSMAGERMNPPRSLADVRRQYLKARRRP